MRGFKRAALGVVVLLLASLHFVSAARKSAVRGGAYASLLEESASLSSSARVKSLVQQFQRIRAAASKSGATPDTKTAIEKLIALIDASIFPAIKGAHEADADASKEQLQRIISCDNVYEKSATLIAVDGTKDARQKIVSDFEEAVSNFEESVAGLQSLVMKRNTANSNRQINCCKHKEEFEKPKEIPFQVPVVECDYRSETKEACSSKIEVNEAAITTYIKLQKAEHDNLLAACDENKRAENAFQGAVEQKILSVAEQRERLGELKSKVGVYNDQIGELVGKANTEYEACRHLEESKLKAMFAACPKDVESSVLCGFEDEVERRKKEWEAVETLKCLFQAYADSDSATLESAVGGCEGAGKNVEALDIDKPSIPPRKAKAADVAAVVTMPVESPVAPNNPERACAVSSSNEYAMVTKPNCPNWCPSGPLSVY